MSDAEYMQRVDATMDKLKVVASTDDDWKFVEEKNGVKIHMRQVEGSPIVMMRGICEIAGSADEILKCTEALDTRSEWDGMFIGGKYVRSLDDTHQLLHFKFKSPSMMVTNRDFALARAVKRCDDGIILSNHISVETDEIPPESGFVRGEVAESGYWIKENEDGKNSLVAYVVQIDPKGWIPTPIVNLVAKKQPMVLGRMRDHMAKLKA